MAEEKRYKVSLAQPKKAVVLRCPDLRLREPHKNFLKQELGLSGGDYFSLKRAGGAIALARPEEMGAEFRSVFTEIGMFLKLHGEIGHIIIINHEDCKKYDATIDREKSRPDPEKRDLLKAAKFLSRNFAGIQIGAYYARFADGKQEEVVFDTIFETDKAQSLRE